MDAKVHQWSKTQCERLHGIKKIWSPFLLSKGLWFINRRSIDATTAQREKLWHHSKGRDKVQPNAAYA